MHCTGFNILKKSHLERQKILLNLEGVRSLTLLPLLGAHSLIWLPPSTTPVGTQPRTLTCDPYH